MNTKEAIETLSHKEMAKFTDHEGLSYKEYVEYKKYREKIDKIIELLQQGEKYKQIVYEINNERLSDEYSGTYGMPSRSEKGIHQRIKTIIEKYFLTTHMQVIRG